MDASKVKLPSNRKFGLFFSIVFLVAASYTYHINLQSWFYILGAVGVIVFFITLVKQDILLPFNKIWMKFGLLLGLIISPIVLGLIFFLVFTPIAFFMRLFGRDELSLRFKKQKSYWVERDSESQPDPFKHQF
jgi:hypothetical protein